MSVSILKILAHTPIWAFVVFAWLVFIGVRSMRIREIRLGSLLITPATFSFFYVYNLTKTENLGLLLSSIALAIAVIIVTYSSENETISPTANGKFTRQASYGTLICGMITFFVRYFCEYKKATVGDAYLVLELISSAVIGGFCVGRNLKFFIQAKRLNSKKSA